MKLLKYSLFIIIAIAFTGCSVPEKTQAVDNKTLATQPAEKKTAPDFKLKKLDSDEEVSLMSFKGKPVLVVFWASWCGYCIKEIPELTEIDNQMKDRISVIAVASNDKHADTVNAVQKHGIKYLVLEDSSNRAASNYDIQGFPTAFLIDAEGKIVKEYVGGNSLTAKMIESELNQLPAPVKPAQ